MIYLNLKNQRSVRYTSEQINKIAQAKINNRLEGSGDPREKKHIIETRLGKAKRDYFEKPTFEGKALIKKLTNELARIDRIISKKSGKSSIKKIEIKKSELYGFAQPDGKKKNNKTNIHSRKIANPVNLWSINETDLA